MVNKCTQKWRSLLWACEHLYGFACQESAVRINFGAVIFFLSNNFNLGLCRTCRRPGDSAQLIQTLYIHKIHIWKFIGIWKMFPICDHLQTCWDFFFSVMICWENYPASSNSEHTQLVFMCVLMYFWGENFIEELSRLQIPGKCVFLVSCLLYHPALLQCSFVAGCEKLVISRLRYLNPRSTKHRQNPLIDSMDATLFRTQSCFHPPKFV